MKLINYMSMAWVALALTACSSDEIGLASPDLFPEVNIKATVKQPGKTRSNPIGTAEQMAKFNTGDQLRLTCEGQEDVIYQLGENGKWMPQNGKLMRWKAQEQTFSAYYPANNALPQWTIVHTDQSVDTENENPSHKIEQADYMSCTVTQQMGNTLNLPMERKTARVIIKVSFNEEYSTEQPNISQMFIHANANLEALNIHGFSQFQPFRNGLEFTALVAPTAAKPDDLFIIMNTDKDNIHVNGIPEFVAGKSYTFNLRIGGGTVTLGEATVEDWTDGVTHDGLVPQGLAPIVDPLTHTIKVQAVGTLTNELVGEALNGGNELKVEGWLNGTDIKAIREATGCVFDPNVQVPGSVPAIVTRLDLSKATLVAGGAAYAKSFGEFMGGAENTDMFLEDYTVSPFMFSTSRLTALTLPESTQKISNAAFALASELKALTLPNELTDITLCAFAMSSIKELTIPEKTVNWNYGTFAFANELEKITIKAPIKTIPEYCFQDCSALKSIIIPNTVETIGKCAFQASGLTALVIPDKVEMINDYFIKSCNALTSLTFKGTLHLSTQAFSSFGNSANCDLTIPDAWIDRVSVGENGTPLFNNLTWKSILTLDGQPLYSFNADTHTITNRKAGIINSLLIELARNGGNELKVEGPINGTDIKAIREATGCVFDANVQTPGSVPAVVTRLDLSKATMVAGGAAYAKSFGDFRIPAGQDIYIEDFNVNTVSLFMFSTSRLTALTLPESTQDIANAAFALASELKSLTLPNELTGFYNYAFAESSIKKLTIPEKTVSWDFFSFANANQLEKIHIKAPIKSIPGYCFQNCSALKSITIPNTVIHIQENAFQASGLTALVISKNVKSIGQSFIAGCQSLTSLTIAGKKGETIIHQEAFTGFDASVNCDLTLHASWTADISTAPDGTQKFMGVPFKSIKILQDYSIGFDGVTDEDML